MFKKLLFIVFITLMSFGWHKQYYSMTMMNYKEKEHSIQITIQLFIDDIELALNKQFDTTTELGTTREIPKSNQLLNGYLSEHFKITINGKDTNFNFIGKEFEKDVLYTYLEIKPIGKIQQIKIQNNILTEIYAAQKNIVKINNQGQNKSLILTKTEDTGLLKF